MKPKMEYIKCLISTKNVDSISIHNMFLTHFLFHKNYKYTKISCNKEIIDHKKTRIHSMYALDSKRVQYSLIIVQ